MPTGAMTTMINKDLKYIKLSIPQDQIRETFENFLREKYAREIVELENADKGSLSIAFLDIDAFSVKHRIDFADLLLEDADTFLEFLTHALRSITRVDKARVRIIRLPKALKMEIREIRADDVGRLISIEGVVSKVTPVMPQIVEAVFECPFCGHIFSIGQNSNQFKEPRMCEQESGGCGKKGQLKLLEEKSRYTNAQKIRLQDALEDLRGGELPQGIDVNLQEDLTGRVVPGDRVVMAGILRQSQKRTQFGKLTTFQTFIDANSLELKEEAAEEVDISDADVAEIEKLQRQPDVYEKLIHSIAPSVYGHEEIKEAIVLQLFGGEAVQLPDGTYKRGDSHILLVGDPGLAKSVLLRAAAKIALRGVYSDGTGASGVGLTAAIIRDREFNRDEWTIAAGTLVLADKGLATVDELEKMKEDERGKLHQALEWQKVNVAKAGINAELNSRCALLAAANPKDGRFDKYKAIGEQINLSPALLSRFDLIFPMIDEPNVESDTQIASHVLNAYNRVDNNLNDFKPVVNHQLLRKYIAHAKKHTRPTLSDAANDKFHNFYIGLRRQSYEDADAPISVTVRQLEALARLGQARARAELRDVVTAEDAQCAINLVTYCLKMAHTDPETGKLDVDWVIAGTTKTRRERARVMEEIIRELGKEHGGEVPIKEILDLTEERGIEREKAEETIERMKRDGILLSLKGGVKFHA